MLGLAVQLLSNVVEDVERVALGTAEAALRESSSATTSMRFLENEEDEEKSSLLEISQSKAYQRHTIVIHSFFCISII